MTTLKPTALKRLKDTFKGDGILPHLERHVMREMGSGGSDRAHDVLHPSDMSHSDWCSRHDFYRIIGLPSEKEAKANPSFRMGNIWSEGTAIHSKYQTWLWEMGVLYGQWRCLSCHLLWKGLSPKFCINCHSPRLVYREVPLQRGTVGGHADGAVHDLDNWSGLIEIKSIGIGTIRVEAPRLHNIYEDQNLTLENLWWRISRPFATHMRQGQLYLWAAWPRYEEIIFIYESKFSQATKEFRIAYNPAVIAPLLEEEKRVAAALVSGKPPRRPAWAEEPDSKVCRSCEHRRTCWNLGEPDDSETEADHPPAVRVQRTTSAKRVRSLRTAGVRTS